MSRVKSSKDEKRSLKEERKVVKAELNHTLTVGEHVDVVRVLRPFQEWIQRA